MKTKIIGAIKYFPFLDSKLQLQRRKWLAAGKGYPDWEAVLEKSPEEWDNAIDSVNSADKVLIATSIGSHLAAMQMETTLAVALSLRGAEIHALLCDGLLPGCQMCEPRFFANPARLVKFGPQKDLCNDCYQPGRKGYEAIGGKVHSY